VNAAIRVILIITASAAISVAVISCTNIPPEAGPETLFVHLSAEPGTLNPVTATDAYASMINQHIYESLVERHNDTLAIVPKLAERWQISADRLRYRFFLRKGIKWHDGRDFTADDIMYSYKILKDPKTMNAHLKVYYIDVKELVKIDKYTVEFIYSKRYHLGLEICGTMPIVPKHIFDDKTDFNSHKNSRSPVGTGPYVFVKWETGKKVELAINEKYWGDKPAIKRVVYQLVQEPNVAFQMLKKRELDLYRMRQIQWVRQTSSDTFNKHFYKHLYYQPQYSYIGWNAKTHLFADRRTRLAMTHLVNRQAILDKLLFGLGEIVTGTFYINGPYNNPAVKIWPYDPERGRALLEEAGWKDTDNDGILDKNGKPFSFTITIASASKFAERLSTILKEDLKKSGIQMNISRYEWAVFVEKLQKRDFEAVTLAWSLGYSGDPYQLWHSSQMEKGSNYCGFSDPESDRIIEDARMEFDENRRIKLYHRFHEILHREQPYTFLFSTPELVAVSRKYDNVKVHTMGLDFLEWTPKVSQ
jgi:peptide/nickel transport system substrate-binding protein